ncbi:MAG: hypothetical protein J6K25_12365 [Thermoguttaceae bacterium]|nr:hypothetical protein [Thermoguttaceae bacterium]
MNRKTRAFNAIFFKELRDSYHYPLAVVGVLLLLAGPLFAPWYYIPEPTLGNLLPTIKEAAELLAGQYAGCWGRYALFSVFVLATLLPAGMFARERKTKEIACLERFPVSLQTVLLAKFSAILALISLVVLGFVLTGFVFDLIYDKKAFTALTYFCADYDSIETSNLKAFALCPLELLIWDAFWATAIRREAFVVAASLLSTFAVWALVGWLVASGKETPGSLAVANTWVLTRDSSVGSLITVGGVASVESAFYATLRFGALLLPLVGLVRVFRRDGAQTTLGNGLTGLDFRLKTLLAKRRQKSVDAASASVPVDANTSAKPCERSTSASSLFVDSTPRRPRPLTALCVETVKSASLFGRFRGAILIDLAILNYLLLNAFSPSSIGCRELLFGAILLWGTQAFVGLRKNRLILTTRLPVRPSVYFASQCFAYLALFAAAFLPALGFQLLFPEAANDVRELYWLHTTTRLPSVPAKEALNVATFATFHALVVLWTAGVARSRIGAFLLCAVAYAVFYFAFWAYALFCFGLSVAGKEVPPFEPWPLLPLVALGLFPFACPFAYLRTRARFKRRDGV